MRKMRFGRVYKFGDVILASMQFVDTFEVKIRPALVLFEEFGNIVVAGVTSNTTMKGISLTKEDGAVVDSVIKLNYVFTISDRMIKKKLFSLNEVKKKKFIEEFMKKFQM